jgi:uncharacterized membrane protein SpoIIM required for sporulation
MKETRFIAQNREKWEESEALLGNSERDPEKLSSLFTQVIDDLSYSRTYYPNRSVRVYLNKIARQYFSIIYSQHKNKRNGFRHFWLDELPQIVYQSRKPLLISLAIFVFAVAIGVFSSLKDPQFAGAILGDDYVAMTKANIEKGDPMAVYKQRGQVDMFLGITFNNLMVAFRTFVLGIFLSIGTVAALLYNGVMIGCFQFFFLERGLFAESALTIWLHGTLEISSIVLAGGAGLVLGSGLLFPGTYSRLQAFQITAMRALKLMLGVAPILVLAAIIESFLTRYTEVPDLLRLLLILLSASFVVGYFVVYPWIKSRNGFDEPLAEVKLAPSLDPPVSVDRIKSNAEILKDTFLFYKKYFRKLVLPAALITLAMTAAEFLSPQPRVEPAYALPQQWWMTLFGNLFYAMKTPSLLYVVVNAVGSSLIFYRVSALLESDALGNAVGGWRWKALTQITFVMVLVYGFIFASAIWSALILGVGFILLVVLNFAMVTEKAGLISGIAQTWRLAAGNFGQAIGLQFILLMMCVAFLLILSAPLLYINTSFLKWNFSESDEWGMSAVNFIEIFARLFTFNLVIPMVTGSAAYLYFSLIETVDAPHLKRAISLLETKYNRVST